MKDKIWKVATAINFIIVVILGINMLSFNARPDHGPSWTLIEKQSDLMIDLAQMDLNLHAQDTRLIKMMDTQSKLFELKYVK